MSLPLCPAGLWGHECDSCRDQLFADRHVSTSQGLLPRVRDTAHTVDSGYWGNWYTHTYTKTLPCAWSLTVTTGRLCCIWHQWYSTVIVLAWLIIKQGSSCIRTAKAQQAHEKQGCVSISKKHIHFLLIVTHCALGAISTKPCSVLHYNYNGIMI